MTPAIAQSLVCVPCDRIPMDPEANFCAKCGLKLSRVVLPDAQAARKPLAKAPPMRKTAGGDRGGRLSALPEPAPARRRAPKPPLPEPVPSGPRLVAKDGEPTEGPQALQLSGGKPRLSPKTVRRLRRDLLTQRRLARPGQAGDEKAPATILVLSEEEWDAYVLNVEIDEVPDEPSLFLEASGIARLNKLRLYGGIAAVACLGLGVLFGMLM